MRLLIIYSFLIVFAAACSDKHEGLAKIANAKMDAMEKHDLEALGKLYADSAKIQSVGFEKTEVGPEGIKGIYKRYFSSTPDLKYEVTNMVMSDKSVVIEYKCFGTMQQSPIEDVIPAYMVGKKYTLANSTRIDIENGKIVKEMTYFDQLAFLRQVGFFDQK